MYYVHQRIRQLCSEENPQISLIGHSTDSAGHSLSLAASMMTPQVEFIKQGVQYLGLGIPDEIYFSPYFWKFPSIYYLDFEHNQRSALRQLKYLTLDLLLYKKDDVQVKATIDHLYQLRRTCIEKNVQCNISESDLLFIKFFDQNSDAAYKIFDLNTSALLEQHVPESMGTSVFIIMIFYMMWPYRNAFAGSPVEAVRSVATGSTIMRMWLKYASKKNLLLHAKSGASNNPKLRGNFMTRQTNTSLEIKCHAAIHHQLALFLHKQSSDTFSPRAASTINIEKFIVQSQSKTSNIQSLNTEPSAAETIDRTSQIQYNVQTRDLLKSKNIIVKPTNSRKKTLESYCLNEKEVYMYPRTYEEFQDELKKAFYEGKQNGQEIVKSKVPLMYEEVEADLDTLHREVKNRPTLVSGVPQYCLNHVPFFKSDEMDSYIAEENEEFCTSKSDVVEETTEIASDKCLEKEGSDSEKSENIFGPTWQISRNGTSIHINRALKIALGSKDIVNKERHMKHWVPKHLPNQKPIPDHHNVEVSKIYCCKVGQVLQIVKIISIQENGKRCESTERKSKAIFQGSIYDIEDTILHRPKTTKITKWLNVCSILTELSLERGMELTTSSTKTLEDIGFFINISKVDDRSNFNDTTDNCAKLAPDQYEVEDVLDYRLCKSTCTIDHIISCLFLKYRSSESFVKVIEENNHNDRVCSILWQMFDLIHDGCDDDN